MGINNLHNYRLNSLIKFIKMYSLVFNYLKGFKTLSIIYLFVICMIDTYHNILSIIVYYEKLCVS